MTKSELDSEISRVLDTVYYYQEESDRAFARGDVVRGVKLFRWSTLAMVRAEELSERAAIYSCARH